MQTPNALNTEDTTARHGRLFELIRQNTLVATQQPATEALTTHQPTPSKPAHRPLLPQEQQALGITATFGR